MEGDASLRLMLLGPAITTDNFTSTVPASLQDTLREHGGTVEPFTIHRSYDDYSVEEAFKVLLPADIEHPSAFEQVQLTMLYLSLHHRQTTAHTP